jgi:hypothetical protein
MSQDSTVSIVTGYRLDGWDSIYGKDKIFLFLRLTQPPFQWVLGAVSLRVKQPGHEAYQSLPSSAEVKNGGAIHSFTPASS